MEDYLINGGILSNIADKIRENDPDTYEGNTITPTEMPSAVDNVWQAGYSRGISVAGVADLTGTTWKLNTVPELLESFIYKIDFTSEGKSFNTLDYHYNESDGGEDNSWLLRYELYQGTTLKDFEEVFDSVSDGWRRDGKYKTIAITGGADATNVDLINWLYVNGELVNSGGGADAPTLVAGNNIEIIHNEEDNTVEVKLANIIKLMGNYPLALTKGTNEYKGYCYINPPALPSGTIDLHVPSKSGTIALLSDLEGLGSSSKAIIDVTELPTENINPNSIYRLPVGTFYAGKDKMPWICRIVETLPSEGEPATSDMASFVLYYETSTNSASGYVDTMLGEMLGVPSGWYPVEALASLLEATYSGVVFSEQDIPNDSLSLLIVYKLYQYTNDWLCINDNVGSVGSGYGAEVFNTPRNIASGDYSHAEGYLTEATHDYAHAEGDGCAASGMSSHAEGKMTASFGHYSHSEGQETIAHGNWQHVQGKYNVQDIDERYAHIVGNGEDGARSNAHTIDWQGNGWFAGTIKVGGTGQDDENAKELATKEYVDSKGGGSADNVASKFTIEVEGSTTVWDVLNATQEAGANLKEWNLINATGHIDVVIGVIYQPFGNGSFGLLKASNLIKLDQVADVKDWATIPFSDFIDGMFSYPTDEMPQIRFTTANGNDRENSTFYVNEDSPLKLTVEIVGGGALQVGDQLQVCRPKRFSGSRANGFKRKYKLQRFAEYVVTEEDLNKRFLTVNIFLTYKTMHGLFRDGDCSDLSPLYLRIRRAKGNMQNNNSGQTVDATFSNVVTLWKQYHRGNQAIRIY